MAHEHEVARRRGEQVARFVAPLWACLMPGFLLLGLVYAADFWCPAPDPDGGMLRDGELCRGDDGALLLGVAQVMLVWLAGLAALIWWSRPPRRSGSRRAS